MGSMFLQSTIYLRGFFKFPLHASTIYLRGFFKFLSKFYILKSTRGFCKFFLPTTLHPSTYQEIYIPSPQFYISPRNIGTLSTFLHSKPYNKPPIHSNSRNKFKNEA